MKDRVVLVVVIGLFGIFPRLAESQADTTDISGTWNFSVDVGDSHGDPTFVLKQEGEKLTGTATTAAARAGLNVTGTVKGAKAVFAWQITRDGQATTATYTGAIESPTKMTGTVEFNGALNGSGTWTATKK